MNKIDFLNNPKYPPNDIGISNLFIDMFKDELIYCQYAGWFWWNGKFWEKDAREGGKVNEFAKEMTKYCITYIGTNSPNEIDYEKYNKAFQKLWLKNYRDTIIKDSMSINPVKMTIFNKHKFLFNCQNGTYDFKRKIFRDFERTDYLTDISNVTYDPKADCPRFKKYLEEVMNNDKIKIDYLLKIASYCMTGDTSRECFFILYGDKTRNGKSTFVNTLTHLMGTYAKSIQPSSITKKTLNTGGGNASPDLAKLNNTRLANVSEIEDGMMLDIALIKQLTGGNTLTARFLYKEQFEFIPQFKILIDTNVLPKMTEDSIFRSNRIHLLCFDRHFEENERDLNLKDKLKTEVNGIFNYILPYFDKLNAEGFIMPQSTKDTIEQYQYNSNNVLLFVKEKLFEDKQTWETISDIYQTYTSWCDENGLGQMSKKTFKDRLSKCGGIIDDRVAQRFNGKGDSIMARGWVRGFNLSKPQNQQLELQEIIDDTIPF